MKNLIALAHALTIFVIANFAQNPNHVYVNGCTKSNGTYVKGHCHTAPNSNINDNFSTYLNVNPYTGMQGTINPTYNFAPDNYQRKSNSNTGYCYSTYATPAYALTNNYYTYRIW